jgi:transcriptional regulator with GAF, ATPase, and Fis domain
VERFAPLLLELWREASGPVEIDHWLSRAVALLSEHWPAATLLVRRIDLSRACVETAAAQPAGATTSGDWQRSELGSHPLEQLLAWCHHGELIHARAPELAARVPGLLPSALEVDVLAGPLSSAEAPAGALIALAAPRTRFGKRDEELLRLLLEPCAAALDSDRRRREELRLRDAALADRQALLSRLGRRELGETIVGTETGLRPVMERVELVSRLDVPVLILGETGSGKEVLARAIHVRSRRAAGPFLRVNCGAIPAGLIDSELFGHERGSFTGASSERKGWFERADQGTLFLDEIGELPLEAQVRLLRVLQDGTLQRVGGQRQITVDVRIVAATHRDLHAMTREGRFREDLWYRIAVFPVQLPPLRDRVEDIPALASHFALRAATRFGIPPVVPTPADLDLLVRYPWPGNIRELAAVIERAVILGDGGALEVARALGPLPAAEDAEHGRPAAHSPLVFSRYPGPSPRVERGDRFPTLDEAAAQHIESALERTRGRIEGPYGAAALLGINPHTLRARMRKLGVNWQRFRGPARGGP